MPEINKAGDKDSFYRLGTDLSLRIARKMRKANTEGINKLQIASNMITQAFSAVDSSYPQASRLLKKSREIIDRVK